MLRKSLAAAALAALLAVPLRGLAAESYAVPRAAVPAPVDRPYPGSIALHVDASDVAQKIFRGATALRCCVRGCCTTSERARRLGGFWKRWRGARTLWAWPT